MQNWTAGKFHLAPFYLMEPCPMQNWTAGGFQIPRNHKAALCLAEG